MNISGKKSILKIIILGDSGVGKTALLDRYVDNKFRHVYRKTIGADFTTKEVLVDDKIVMMQMWDSVGQERFKPLGTSFYRGADCVILVYDVTSPSTYDSLKTWKDEFLNQRDPNDQKNFPFIVLANKTDLGNSVLCEKKLEDVLECTYEVPYYETSAKDNINVDIAFFEAAKMALNREGDYRIFNSYLVNLLQ